MALVVAAGGCGPEEISEKEAQSYVEKWADHAEQSLERQVGAAEADEQFETLAHKAADRDSGDVQRSEPPYAVLTRDAYAETGWRLRFAARDGLSDRGRAVWDVISKADRHALDREAFEFDSVRKRLERIRKLSEKIDSVSAYKPSEREKTQARKWLTGKKRSEFELVSDNFEQLARALTETSAGDGLKERISKLESLVADRAHAMAQLELLVAHDTARYARKMKHFRVRHLFIHEREDDYWRDPVTDGERPDEAKGPYVAGIVRRRAAKVADTMKEPTEILHRRIRETLERTLTRDEPARVLRNLEPQNPRYGKLKKAYQTYRSIAEEGGWSEVSEEPYLDPGDTAETVAALKKRLQTEGYYPEDAPVDESYGDQLEAAVERYQETHQIKVTGEPHESFWSSLNKSAEWRKRQLGLNLQRWRESDVRHSDPMYVLVNISGAHVEVWKNQERAMRFRVVVGNNKSVYSEKKNKTVHPNQTPEVSAYIDRVIYNPYWNITDRIRRTEILPKARKSVEQRYKAKLKELRLEKRRLERSLAAAGGAEDGEDSERSGPLDEETSSGGQLLVARSGSEGSSGEVESDESANPGPNSGGDTPRSSSDGDDGSPEDAAGSDPPDSSSGSGDGETDAEASETSSEGGGDGSSSGGSEEKSVPAESVEIGDLYRMVDDEESRIEEVRKKTVFDVGKIRRLIEQKERLATRDDGRDDDNSGKMARPDESTSNESTSEDLDEPAESGDEKPKSPLQKKFPYLDPETGKVDVSTTDPDNVPAWYENNDYEVMFPGKKWEYVRMKQGRQNALGRVKVIFPNRHDIYLHDTPKKQLFERNIRAFSHGCMRMDKPLSFAEYLLKQDGSLGEVDVDEILEHKKRVKAENDPDREWKRTYEYRPVFLDREIPVYVDYFTTRVDDDGRVHFYADIYDRDAEALGRDSGD